MKTYLVLNKQSIRKAKHIIGSNPATLVMDDGTSWLMDGQFGRIQNKAGDWEVYYPMAIAPSIASIVSESDLT